LVIIILRKIKKDFKMFIFNFLLGNISGVMGVLSTNVNAYCEEDAYDIIIEEFGRDIEILDCTCIGPAFDEDVMECEGF
jgi:hypothetical protein